MKTLLKVSSKSNPNSVAGAISGMFKDGEKEVELQAVGAGAVNQSIKSVAIARGFLVPSGIDIVCIPSFSIVEMENDAERTGIRLLLKVI